MLFDKLNVKNVCLQKIYRRNWGDSIKNTYVCISIYLSNQKNAGSFNGILVYRYMIDTHIRTGIFVTRTFSSVS